MLYRHYRWLIPVLLFIAIAPLTPALDLTVAHYLYNIHNGFPSQHPVYELFYQYGELPALLTGFLAAIMYLLSYPVSSWRQARKPALMLILTLMIGAGLISNILLKDHWGRPRPKQIVEFEGAFQYLPFYQPNFGEHLEARKSFPCGHATMGFYFLAFIRIGIREKYRPLIWFGALTTIFLGLGLSFSRMAMGGHFLSDVLASALIMWLTTLTVEWLLYSEEG